MPRTEVLLVCSRGGHLSELFALRGAWENVPHAWVTYPYSDNQSVLKGEQVFFAYPQSPGRLKNVGRNLILAWRLLGRIRPKVVITTGAAVAVPFAWVARVRGARIVYVESATRVRTPSLSCRLVYPVADRVYVQWPELQRVLPRAIYAGSVFSGE